MQRYEVRLHVQRNTRATPAQHPRNTRAISSRFMKSSSFPSLRVELELREAAESVLRDGETLTSLIEASVHETIQRRRMHEGFIARGLRSREDAVQTGIHHSAESVHSELQQRLDARRISLLG